MALPGLTQMGRSTQTVVTLAGLNLTGSAAGGEWAWTQNVDSGLFPMARRREKRLRVGRLKKPNGIWAGEKLALVDGTTFYYNGYRYTGETLTDSWKTMVGMGSSILIFPDKVAFDTVSHTFSRLEQVNDIKTAVTVTLARQDGTAFTGYTTAAKAPEDPANGDLWLDTSESPVVMKSWSESAGMWVDEYTTYVKVGGTGIGKGLNAYDAVEVTGLTGTALNGTWVISSCGDDYIVFTGIIESQRTFTTGVKVSRTVPDMDYVVEHNNRLWGCSSEQHEIYACAIGDATNWKRFEGISTDSYTLSVGSPGAFTGAAVVNSSVCFFKESCIHKVYGTMPSNFQMSVDKYRGVAPGSAGSTVAISELLYYKSSFDVCRYDGSEVYGFSQALGPEKWKNAVCGCNDRTLYISMQDEQGDWYLLTYDTLRGIWLREDSTQALAFAQCQNETFMLDSLGQVWALKSGAYADGLFMLGEDFLVQAEEEGDDNVRWVLRTGEIGKSMPDWKHVGRIELLVSLAEGARLTVKVRKDGGSWEEVMTVTGGEKRRWRVPIYPRRCDRLEIELSGVGDFTLENYSYLVSGGYKVYDRGG